MGILSNIKDLFKLSNKGPLEFNSDFPWTDDGTQPGTSTPPGAITNTTNSPPSGGWKISSNQTPYNKLTVSGNTVPSTLAFSGKFSSNSIVMSKSGWPPPESRFPNIIRNAQVVKNTAQLLSYFKIARPFGGDRHSCKELQLAPDDTVYLTGPDQDYINMGITRMFPHELSAKVREERLGIYIPSGFQLYLELESHVAFAEFNTPYEWKIRPDSIITVGDEEIKQYQDNLAFGLPNFMVIHVDHPKFSRIILPPWGKKKYYEHKRVLNMDIMTIDDD